MSVEARLIVDGKFRYDIKVECDVKRGHCTGLLTEANGNKLVLSNDSRNQIELEDGRVFDITVGRTKYYDTLVFISEPTKFNT